MSEQSGASRYPDYDIHKIINVAEALRHGYDWGIDSRTDAQIINAARVNYAMYRQQAAMFSRRTEPTEVDGRLKYGDVLIVDSKSPLSDDYAALESYDPEDSRRVAIQERKRIKKMKNTIRQNGDIIVNPNNPAPVEVLNQVAAIDVYYLAGENDTTGLHRGALELHRSSVEDVSDFFALALFIKFPINEVAPAAQYDFDEGRLMAGNVSSSFNYQPPEDEERPTKHALGLAFDINPLVNPRLCYSEDEVEESILPADALMDENAPGALYDDHALVKFMRYRGWIWGGDWKPGRGQVDYGHFEWYYPRQATRPPERLMRLGFGY
jgi:hypothetical protein